MEEDDLLIPYFPAIDKVLQLLRNRLDIPPANQLKNAQRHQQQLSRLADAHESSSAIASISASVSASESSSAALSPIPSSNLTVQATAAEIPIAIGDDHSHSNIERNITATVTIDIEIVNDDYDNGTVLTALVDKMAETTAEGLAIAPSRSTASVGVMDELEEVMDEEEEDLHVSVDKIVTSTGRQKKYVLAALLANRHVRQIRR